MHKQSFKQLGSDSCKIDFTVHDTAFQLFDNLALNIAKKRNHHIKFEGKHFIPYLKWNLRSIS